MELKEYFVIIKKNSRLFLLTAIFILAVASAFLYSRPVSYTASLILNITRSGVQNTENYKYDNFYRLQADEKFSETLVEWLRSPIVEEEIFREAGINTSTFSLKQLAKSIKAEKMSSQVVSVSFSALSKKDAQNIAQAVSKIISQKTQELDKDQKDSTWFQVISETPVIRLDKISLLTAIFVFLGAFFVAFWISMLKHYLE
jgi:capsular polysaccharide biosynthesis protein